MENQKLSLGDVQETALIPLSNRAMETLRKNPRVKDPVAVKIIQTLGIDTKKYDKTVTHECVIARTIMFDEKVRKIIRKYPNAVCINMGCGMDDRYSRVDNGQIFWFDVDLEDSIEVRRKLFEDTDRRRMISASVLEKEWMENLAASIDSDRKIIVIAEGLFMYFSKEENQQILNNLTSVFQKGSLIVELMRPSAMDEKRHETKAKFGWGTKSGKEFELLDPKMKLISENSFSEQMMKSTVKSRMIGFLIQKFNNRIAVFEW